LFNLGESQQKRVAKPPTHVDEEPFFLTFFFYETIKYCADILHI